MDKPVSLYKDENLVSYKEVHHAVSQIYDFHKIECGQLSDMSKSKGAHMSDPI